MQKFIFAPLALALLLSFSAGAAEVASRGTVVTDPVHRNLRVQSVSLMPAANRASVRLAANGGKTIIVIPGEVRASGCDETGCCPGGSCGTGSTSGITVELDLKDAGDHDMYATLLQAHAHSMTVTLITKGGKIAQVDVTASYPVYR